MIDRLVSEGCVILTGDGTVEYLLFLTVTSEQVGFMGIAWRSCWRYQANILWPNLDGWEEAPATANCFAVKNFAAAACMSFGGGDMCRCIVLWSYLVICLSLIGSPQNRDGVTSKPV